MRLCQSSGGEARENICGEGFTQRNRSCAKADYSFVKMRCKSPIRVDLRQGLTLQVLDNEPENEITITVFRLLVLDLLPLFQVLNFGVINILGMIDLDFPEIEH